MSALRIVVPRYGEQIVGGSESLARRLAGALACRGWDLQVWTSTATDEATWASVLRAGEDREGEVAVRRFAPRWGRPPRSFHQLSRGLFRLPPRLRPEAAWLALQGPFMPTLVKALASAEPMPTLFIPYLYHPTIRGLAFAPHPRIMIPAAHDEPALRLRAVGRAINAADALWYSTPEERELVESVHPAARERPAAVGTVGIEIPNGLDAHAFARAQGISGPYLLYGGRVTPGKGLEELLEGLRRLVARHPGVSLVLTGGAARAAMSEPWILRVGRLDEATYREALAGAAAVIAPSFYESLSLLVLEAWAVGTPCIVNAASPVLAAQAERGGGALGYHGPEELAAAAARLLDGPGLRGRLGRSGREYVAAEHRWEVVVGRLESLIAGT